MEGAQKKESIRGRSDRERGEVTESEVKRDQGLRM